MTSNLFRTRLLATSMIAGVALASTPALAQTTAGAPATPEASAADEGQTIIVTGSRIASPNMTSIAPVTSVTSQDIKLSGTSKVEDLLNSLPQVFASQSSTLSNGATGAATIDLRGLGSQRTLVLINGRRLMPGDPFSSAADINFIPSSLIKRIDVLTGGASATYGADAVAGVVNFIMDTDFTGFRIDGNYSVYQHTNRSEITPPLLNKRQAAGLTGYGYPQGNTVDGGTIDATVSFGTKFDDDRGHMTGYFGYRKQKPVIQSERDYSACTIQNTAASVGGRLNPAAPLQCGGSATNAPGNVFFHTAATATSTVGALGPGTLTKGSLGRYNFAPTNYFQRPDERYTAGFFADYEVSKGFHPYAEFMFMDDQTNAQIAPSGDFGNTLTINCDNPLLSAQQKTLICQPNNYIVGTLGTFPLTSGLYNQINGTTGPQPAKPFFDPITGAQYNQAFLQLLRRNVEGGSRNSNLQHTSFRGLIGARGELGSAWSYDAYYQYGRTNYSQVYSNEFSVARLRNALDVVTGPGGVPACRSALTGSDPNCVPYDVFGVAPSAASVAYLSATGFQKGRTSEQVASASFSGKLGEYGIQSPLSDTGVNINVGFEYRKEALVLQTDNAFQTGDLTGQGGATLPVSGSYNVKEVFGEIVVPIVTDGFIYDLNFQGGYRYSHYEISNGGKFNTQTYKLGLDFAPIKDIRFRGGYNRAVRVPNIQELFAPQTVSLDGVTDPCAGITITAANTGCISQGLAIGQTVTPNPAGQYNGFQGGNPNLRPEIATTKTLGVILAPRYIPNLSLSVDFFDIKIKKAIQGFGADAILAACTNDNNPLACGLIKRNAAGSLWLSPDGFVVDLQRNVGSVQTRGFEFNGNYSHQVGDVGTVSVNFVGTLLDKFSTDNGLTQTYDCAGYYGPTCGTPAPKWRHKARVSFSMPNGIGLSGQWRYFGPVDVEYKNSSTTLSGDYYNFGSRIKSQSYFDLALSANIMGKFTWRLGVNNLLDRQPPLVTSGSGAFGGSACAGTFCNGNTYPGTYDSLGRYLYSGISLDF
ncbi:TonB-dependent siderophore receptor [Sphingomonas sp.]|uniref:TonB-dependent receptor plug domain-containing protein n=1 Tax=Sphingomonas sp. TaxID=28214 RepID=UPI0025E188BA|nr:TonB-dependent receptor [Sphingomonas sp.]